MKQTVLHPQHMLTGALMTEFQGWRVPAQFGDPAEEYHALRNAAGLFDVGFLGRIEVSGSGSEEALQRSFTRNLSRLAEGTAVYGLFCSEQGGIVDGSLVFRLPSTGSGPRFLATTNAVATDKVRALISSGPGKDVQVIESTESLAQFALQGPHADAVLESATGASFKRLKQKNMKEIRIPGGPIVVSRTGCTAERGFELFVPSERARDLWLLLLEAGKAGGQLPCGMICREMARVEAGYAIAGNELDETRNPVAAGLLSVVDLNAAFTSRDAVAGLKAAGPQQKLIGFELYDKGIPRSGATIFSESKEIGVVTSGVHSIARRKDIGLGYVLPRYSQPGQEIEIELKDREATARVVAIPLYRKK